MSHPPGSSEQPSDEGQQNQPDQPTQPTDQPGYPSYPPPFPPAAPSGPSGPAYDPYDPSYGQQSYGQQAWGQQQQQQPWGGPYAPGTVPGGQPPQHPPLTPVPPTSGRATAAVVLGALSVVACGLFTGIPAILVGISARREIKESQGRLAGDGVALGGIVAGIVGTVLSLLFLIFLIVVVIVGVAVDDSSNDNGGITTRGLPPASAGAL